MEVLLYVGLVVAGLVMANAGRSEDAAELDSDPALGQVQRRHGLTRRSEFDEPRLTGRVDGMSVSVDFQTSVEGNSTRRSVSVTAEVEGVPDAKMTGWSFSFEAFRPDSTPRTGDPVFDDARYAEGPDEAVIAAWLDDATRERILRRSMRLDKGVVTASRTGWRTAGLDDLVDDVIAVGRALKAAVGSTAERLTEIACTNRQPGVQLRCARLLAERGDHREVRERWLAKVLAAPDVAVRIEAARHAPGFPAEAMIKVVNDAHLAAGLRAQALDLIAVRADASHRQTVSDRLLPRLETLHGSMLVTALKVFRQTGALPPLELLERRFWSVDRETREAILETAREHGEAAKPFLDRARLGHRGGGLALAGEASGEGGLSEVREAGELTVAG